MDRFVLNVLLPPSTLVQMGDHVTGGAIFVVVSIYTVPAPEFVAENVTLVPETTGEPVNLRVEIPAEAVTTLNTPVFGLKL